MYSPLDDLDPRLIVLHTDAHYLVGSQPINGKLILSRAGLHFYGFKMNWRHKEFEEDSVEHLTFADIDDVHHDMFGKDLGLTVIMPRALGAVKRKITIGYGKAVARGSIAEMIAGAANLTKYASTQAARIDFLAAIADLRSSGAPLSLAANEHPHLVRMRYFTETGALGAGIHYATLAIRCGELQDIARRGPNGGHERAMLSEAGWDKRAPALPHITAAEATNTRRARAWLLLDSQRYHTLMTEAATSMTNDAEVMVAFGAAYAARKAAGMAASFFERAEKLDPENWRVRVAGAWRAAIEKRATDVVRIVAATHDAVASDRQSQFIVGCALEEAGHLAEALDAYLAFARLSHGYFEGIRACKHAFELAQRLGGGQEVRIAKLLTENLPDQPAAWTALAAAARSAHDEVLARTATEHVTALLGGML